MNRTAETLSKPDKIPAVDMQHPFPLQSGGGQLQNLPR